MKDKLLLLEKELFSEIEQCDSLETLDAIDLDYFGRKEGKLTVLLKSLKSLSLEEKKELGSKANQIKNEAQKRFEEKRIILHDEVIKQQLESEWIDVTKDIKSTQMTRCKGSLNPVTHMQRKLEDLFVSLGFSILNGPELCSDFYNFEGLNIPKDHPARDMTDTFYIKGHQHLLMRPHTSNAQVRALLEHGAPLRIVNPGRVFRNEDVDARHEHTFYQCEGMIVDEVINYSHLKYLLHTIAKELFGQNTQVRFNPKFYPFVEPGFSGDVTCFLCNGEGCNVCKQSGWLEFFGAGVVHPEVLRAGNIDTTKYRGIAFGLGFSRMTQLLYNIDDARLVQSGDLRFLKQF